jgi:hypothetical protein
MDDEPEAIRQQMTETRAALSEKLETLEQQVVETVQGATTAVNETVENVKEAVHDTVETVKGGVRDTVESVKEVFDLSGQVERHSWLMFGGAVFLGYLGGRLFPANGHERPPDERAPALAADAQFEQCSESPEVRIAATRRGTEANGWTKTLAPELKDLRGLALGGVLGLVRDVVEQSMPKNMAPSWHELVDRITAKLGGHPVAGPVLEAPDQSRWRGDGYEACRATETTSAMTPAC